MTAKVIKQVSFPISKSLIQNKTLRENSLKRNSTMSLLGWNTSILNSRIMRSREPRSCMRELFNLPSQWKPTLTSGWCTQTSFKSTSRMQLWLGLNLSKSLMILSSPPKTKLMFSLALQPLRSSNQIVQEQEKSMSNSIKKSHQALWKQPWLELILRRDKETLIGSESYTIRHSTTPLIKMMA